MSKTLLIVDIQNDFCPGGSLQVKDGDQIVPIINKVRTVFPLVIFTQDWHPSNHQSFAVNHPDKKPGDIIDLDGISQILWPVHCVQESVGAQFHPDLVVHEEDFIFQKGTDWKIDSYSTFYDNAHRKSTGLTDFLKEQNCSEVYICGLATDYCVKFSVFDAIDEGFKTNVILDACRGVNLNPGDVERSVEEMKAKGAKIMESRELLT